MGNSAAAIVLVVLAALVCFWVAAVRSIVTDARLSAEARVGWVIVVLIAPFLGAVLWFAVRRRHGAV